MKRLVSLALVCFGVGCASEGAPNPLGPPAPGPLPAMVPTMTGRGGAASTVDIRATAAAIDVLKGGGNAIDAAVASAAVLGVTDPFSCGIGGGGFMVIYVASEKQVITIDHREVAPQSFSSSLFYEAGTPIPFNDLLTSGLSVGVPGTLMAWDEALRRYGTLSLAQALEPGARVAEDGFDVDLTFNDQTTRNIDRFKAFTSSSALFLTADSAPYAIGDIFKNPDLAATYRQIAEAGPSVFYGGPIGEAIVDTLASPPVTPGSSLKVRPGVMELSDLASYDVRIRKPVESSYRGYTVYGMGLPSSGGLTVAMALNILEGFDPKGLSGADLLHRYLEASRLAFADRGAYMGDPEFVDAPVAGLLSPAYAAERRALIDVTKASTMAAPPGNPYAFDDDPSTLGPPADPMGAKAGSPEPGDVPDKETTHISVVDEAGNIVSYTCTIEFEGGNGMVVPGFGFLLNNELTDFNIPADPAASHPNVAEAGKRPRSSMSPVIVFKGGEPVLTLGSPGGSTIITTVLQMLVNHLDMGMSIDEALAAPRVSQRNAGDAASSAEPAFLTAPEAAGLLALGHLLTDAGPIGAATAIRFNEGGTLTAAAEPVRRNGGSALVVTPEP